MKNAKLSADSYSSSSAEDEDDKMEGSDFEHDEDPAGQQTDPLQ